MNGLQTVKQWRAYFGKPNPSMLGLMNAIYPVGKVIGLLPCTFLADRFGRKVPLTTGLVICIIGAALQGASQNVGMFIAARCVLGFGTSFLVQPSPILITELAFPTHRGKATATYNTFFVRI